MIVQLIFSIFGFLMSLPGLFVFLVGLVLFLLLPVIPAVLGIGRTFANLYLWFAMWSVKRAAIVVSEHGELLFKRITFDDLGVEKVSFGTEEKEFEDPATALHHWMHFPFALADEVHGVLFDPRHAAIGQRKRDARERNEMQIRATDSEWDTYKVYGWIKGVFEMPNSNELVDLSAVRALVTGNERAEYPGRIETMYKNSRIPYASRTPLLRLLIPAGVFVGVLIVFWQLGGRSEGTPNSTVGRGLLALLVSHVAITETVRDVDWLRIGKWALISIPLPAIFVVLALVTNPVYAVVVFVVLGMGFLTLPLLTVLARPSKKLGGGLARNLYLKLGLLGYDRPVLEWTPQSYRLREHDDLETTGDVTWYGLAGSLIGFTFAPSPDSFGPEVMDSTEIKTRRELATDGGAVNTNLPAGYVRYPEMQRAVYAGYVPKTLIDGYYYLNSGIALSRMTNAAIGEKSMRRLLWAKEEYGEGAFNLSDRALLYMTGGAMVIGSGLGVFLFFL